MTTGTDRPRLALHVCCGPCATSVVERLWEEVHVEAVWYNPNIQPTDEYERRLEAMRYLAQAVDLPLTVLDYDVERWEAACAGLMAEPEGGARCPVCFAMRMRKVAQFAAQRGIEYFTTTLTVSPHKPATIINDLGLQIARECGIAFVERDFKKADGFKRSVQLSRELGLYRQRYCGCLPSLRDAREHLEKGK